MKHRVERICGDCHLADDIEGMVPIGLHWPTGTITYRHATPGGCDMAKAMHVLV